MLVLKRQPNHRGARRALGFIMSAVLASGAWVAPSAAAAATPAGASNASALSQVGQLHLTPDQAARAQEKLGFISDKSIWAEFVMADGVLTTADTLSVIGTKYDLTPAQMTTISAILAFAQGNPTTSPSSASAKVQPQLSVSNGRIYLTYSDMVGAIFIAASAGPVALYAALEALAWVVGGPVGGAIVLILGILGAPSLPNLVYTIIQAHVLHRGVYFGLTWNPFPNIETGLWCGCN